MVSKTPACDCSAAFKEHYLKPFADAHAETFLHLGIDMTTEATTMQELLDLAYSPENVVPAQSDECSMCFKAPLAQHCRHMVPFSFASTVWCFLKRAGINGEGTNRRHGEVQPSISLGGMAWNLKAVSVHLSAGIPFKACPHYVTFSRDQCGFAVFDDGKVWWCPHQAVPQIVHSCATLLAYEVAPLSEECCVQEHIQMLIVQHLIGAGSLDWSGQRVPHAARGSQSSGKVSPKYGYMSLRGWACCNSVCYFCLGQKLQLLRGEGEAASDTFEEQRPAMRGDGVALNTQGPPCHLDSTPMPKAIPGAGTEDEDDPDDDTGFPGTHLPAIDDHIQRFASDVQGLVNKFVGTGESFSVCLSYLRSLPASAPFVQALGPRKLSEQLARGLQSVGEMRMPVLNAVKLTLPHWLCHDYRLCVLSEAAARSTSFPAQFFLDSIVASGMSLVHKDAHVVTSGYTSKARPWFFGVADPGTGKSHSIDPCLGMVEEVFAECTEERVGQPELNFHVVRTRSYTGFEDGVRATGGYGLMLTGDGSCWLAKA